MPTRPSDDRWADKHHRKISKRFLSVIMKNCSINVRPFSVTPTVLRAGNRKKVALRRCYWYVNIARLEAGERRDGNTPQASGIHPQSTPSVEKQQEREQSCAGVSFDVPGVFSCSRYANIRYLVSSAGSRCAFEAPTLSTANCMKRFEYTVDPVSRSSNCFPNIQQQ